MTLTSARASHNWAKPRVRDWKNPHQVTLSRLPGVRAAAQSVHRAPLSAGLGTWCTPPGPGRRHVNIGIGGSRTPSSASEHVESVIVNGRPGTLTGGRSSAATLHGPARPPIRTKRGALARGRVGSSAPSITVTMRSSGGAPQSLARPRGASVAEPTALGRSMPSWPFSIYTYRRIETMPAVQSKSDDCDLVGQEVLGRHLRNLGDLGLVVEASLNR